MTAAEFKKKWSRYQGKETSAYQGHFDDLCRLLGLPTPAEADPSGSDFFCFQKRVVKDAELLNFEESRDCGESTERGFADVWKKGCFAWEYKGKKKNLDEAYKQLLRYRESLLNPPLLRILGEAAEADWQFIQPSIMGTLFERALEPEQRSQLGAHYTGEADIKTLVEPVLMQPFRREWAKIKGELTSAYAKGKGNARQRDRLAKFQKQLSSVTVLDPACGSGNFLYVSLQLLLGLEKEVITFAAQLGFTFKPQVSVPQLKAIEINPYAFELAQVSVQIGYLQWRRDNGFDNDRSPVLQALDGFQNEDALLVPHFRNKAKTLKEAQAGEHGSETALKFYTEREWPECDVIVSNPPFLGGSRLWQELGRGYQHELWRIYKGRIPGVSDLCCYWFEKAREQIKNGKCKRAGMLATQGIRGGANREVLKRLKVTGDIFFAESDRDWILSGATVHVSMVGFDDGADDERMLDGKRVETINSNLTSHADITRAARLKANSGCCFIGTKKAGEFEIDEKVALSWLNSPNPHGRPNSDVLRRWVNGNALVTVRRAWWIVDGGVSMSQISMAGYAEPFEYVLKTVKPERDANKEKRTKDNFWIHKRPGPEMRSALAALERCVAVVRHSKHLIFCWLDAAILPDDGIYIFNRDDDLFFGIVASRIHAVWAYAQGTQVREKESGFRYTPISCFETFPFPFSDDLQRPAPPQIKQVSKSAYPKPDPNQGWADAEKYYSFFKESPPSGGAYRDSASHRAAIAVAGKDLNELRERWLNPPEWTETRTLEFLGTIDGPWSRFVDLNTVNTKSGGGIVRYPRIEPKDEECAAKLKKRTLTNLYNERPAWLDLAHKKLDAAVAAAYGWPADLTDEQILERLLELNLKRANEEAKAATTAKPKTSREKHSDELI